MHCLLTVSHHAGNQHQVQPSASGTVPPGASWRRHPSSQEVSSSYSQSTRLVSSFLSSHQWSRNEFIMLPVYQASLQLPAMIHHILYINAIGLEDELKLHHKIIFNNNQWLLTYTSLGSTYRFSIRTSYSQCILWERVVWVNLWLRISSHLHCPRLNCIIPRIYLLEQWRISSLCWILETSCDKSGTWGQRVFWQTVIWMCIYHERNMVQRLVWICCGVPTLLSMNLGFFLKSFCI